MRYCHLAVILSMLTAGPALAGDPQWERDPNAPFAGTIRLPEGFSATVFHEGVGRARHIAVDGEGDVYIALRGGGGLVALRDTDGDGVADQEARREADSDTGIAVVPGYRVQGDETGADGRDWLYFSGEQAVYRIALPVDALMPEGVIETIVSGFPNQRSHAAKPLAFDGKGHLYVTSGAPSNNCQQQPRSAGSPGRYPCDELELTASLWRFDANRPGQTQQADRVKVAKGLRHAVGIAWSDAAEALYFVQHGRDQLNTLWPEHYTDEDNAELPAEAFHRVAGADADSPPVPDFGWPYSYWDQRRDTRILSPEYGGDGVLTPDSDPRFAGAGYEAPLVAFPGHWAPNGLLFHPADAADGANFPARYQGGAFIAFHGSWNRAPLEQGGYKVVFVPMGEDGLPKNDRAYWEVFADGFPQIDPVASSRDAVWRPMGLATGPDGALYIADSVEGRIWRITYDG